MGMHAGQQTVVLPGLHPHCVHSKSVGITFLHTCACFLGWHTCGCTPDCTVVPFGLRPHCVHGDSFGIVLLVPGLDKSMFCSGDWS